MEQLRDEEEIKSISRDEFMLTMVESQEIYIGRYKQALEKVNDLARLIENCREQRDKVFHAEANGLRVRFLKQGNLLFTEIEQKDQLGFNTRRNNG